ncbi:hypothetical protein ZWY2020_022945 [Hordeum vulgare]|nr:hypothetical protein ZWY2020_022945 [Hordeum vulgare]
MHRRISLLSRLFKKHAERLSLDVQWRPLYETLIQTHFKKNMGPEGWKVRQQHFETITSLVRASRTFFPEGAAAEIWLKFRISSKLVTGAKLSPLSIYSSSLWCPL